MGPQQGWCETGAQSSQWHSLRRTAAAQAWVATYVAAKVKLLNMTWVIVLSLALELTVALMSTVCTPPRPHMACCRSCDGTASLSSQLMMMPCSILVLECQDTTFTGSLVTHISSSDSRPPGCPQERWEALGVLGRRSSLAAPPRSGSQFTHLYHWGCWGRVVAAHRHSGI